MYSIRGILCHKQIFSWSLYLGPSLKHTYSKNLEYNDMFIKVALYVSIKEAHYIMHLCFLWSVQCVFLFSFHERILFLCHIFGIVLTPIQTKSEYPMYQITTDMPWALTVQRLDTSPFNRSPTAFITDHQISKCSMCNRLLIV